MNNRSSTFIPLGEIAVDYNEYIAMSLRLDDRFSLGRNLRVPSESGERPQFLKNAFIADVPNVINIGWIIAQALRSEYAVNTAERKNLEEIVHHIESVNPDGHENRQRAIESNLLEFGFNRYTSVRRLPNGRYQWTQTTYAPTAGVPLAITLVTVSYSFESMMATLWLIFKGLSSRVSRLISDEMCAELDAIRQQIEDAFPAVVSALTE